MSAAESITTSVDHHDGTAVVTVDGEIDLSTAPAFEAAIARALEDDPPGLIIDLSGVTFMASVGLRVLVATHEGSLESVRVGVVANGPATSRPMQMTGLDEIIALYPSLDQALTAVQPPARG